jgi:salicylate hydroxylase
MATLPVVIAGAGIAGLTAAAALARAGVQVVLVERRAGFSEVGAGLQLSPNAVATLAALELAAPVGRMAVATERLDIRRWGEPRGFAGMVMGRAADGAGFWAIRRSDLQTALLDSVRMLPGVRLVVGRSVTGHVETRKRIAVTFENDKGQCDTLEAAALIGADGVRSAVRQQMGDAASPRFLGYEAWRTLIPAANVSDFVRAPNVNLWLGRDMHAVHYPVEAGRSINLVLIRGGRDPSPEWDRPGDPALLTDLMAAASAPLKGLLAAAPQWRVWSLFDRAPARMAEGHVALIGDAAHPVLPFLAQGAGLAIEDAAVLARTLAPAVLGAGDVPAALATFARQRQGRAAKVQEAARCNGRIYHCGFPLAQARDFALARLGDAGMRKRYGWIYDWRLD